MISRGPTKSVANYFGIDLAWGDGSGSKPANETGVVRLQPDGTISDAGWTVGITETARWIIDRIEPGDVVAIDAPLVVVNPLGMRECEREVGQRYGRWKVAANATNLTRASLGGVMLRTRLESEGVHHDDGTRPTPTNTASMFECYPYTTLVGAEELGYDVERPRYKRKPRELPTSEWKAHRAANCDDLILRIAGLEAAQPTLRLDSHLATAAILMEQSPLNDRAYRHREDLIDAVLCAWTAGLWHLFGTERCQVLGETSAPDGQGRRATIIAPARRDQRRWS